ncbi:MerR family transcriptional regulator [Niveibacterium sp. SC-1]|uniref:MerR family transcriptional regulator n=1 Tax=Niveibacterium sp. SC-1 TaxID=3135646 RepID=UPI00311D3C66
MSFRPSPSLIPIGSFSAATLLTQKTLRFYAEQGILKPAWVDPENGYRYYRGEQISLARRIQMMRELGMALSEVAAVNAAAEESAEAAASRLSQFWARRLAQFDAECDTYRALLFGLLEPATSDAEGAARVRLRDEPGGWVLCLDTRAVSSEIGDAVSTALGQLHEAAERCKVRPAGPEFTRCHGMVNPENPVPVQICLPISERIEAPAGMRVWRDAPRTFAYVRVSGEDCEFPRILLGLEMVVDWLVEHGKLFVGHVPRVIGVPGQREADGLLSLDLAWPFTEPDEGAV